MPRFSLWRQAALVAVLLAACAHEPAPRKEAPSAAPVPLPALPATFMDEPDCPGCLAATITLRPDGSFLLREELGASEFYDFGRWHYAAGTLVLAGDRDTRNYPLKDLKQAPQVQPLRGPFRMVGSYDGASFTECRTGLAWKLAQTRAAQNLSEEYAKQGKGRVLVALDAQLEGSPETLRVFRPATVLDAPGCPG